VPTAANNELAIASVIWTSSPRPSAFVPRRGPPRDLSTCPRGPPSWPWRLLGRRQNLAWLGVASRGLFLSIFATFRDACAGRGVAFDPPLLHHDPPGKRGDRVLSRQPCPRGRSWARPSRRAEHAEWRQTWRPSPFRRRVSHSPALSTAALPGDRSDIRFYRLRFRSRTGCPAALFVESAAASPGHPRFVTRGAWGPA